MFRLSDLLVLYATWSDLNGGCGSPFSVSPWLCGAIGRDILNPSHLDKSSQWVLFFSVILTLIMHISAPPSPCLRRVVGRYFMGRRWLSGLRVGVVIFQFANCRRVAAVTQSSLVRAAGSIRGRHEPAGVTWENSRVRQQRAWGLLATPQTTSSSRGDVGYISAQKL